MELIDRYVNEVGRRLPRRQRADVRRELRSALLDALESRVEGEPGEQEVVRLLKEFGRPEDVAASYRPAAAYLIGPELYPTFRMVVGITLGVLSAVLLATFALQLVLHAPGQAVFGARLARFLTNLFQAMGTAFGCIVLAFAVLQRFEARPDEPVEDWDPRELPPVVRPTDLVGRGEAVAGIVFPAIVLVLLHLFRDRIGVVVHPGSKLLLNDVLQENLLWLSSALLLGIGVHAVLLWQGRWSWPTRLADLAADLFGIFVLYRIAAAVASREAVLQAEGLPAALLIRLAWGLVALISVLVVVGALRAVVRAARSK